MKRRFFTVAMVAALTSSMLFTSCVGSFSLTNKLLNWNKSIDSRLVNALVYIPLTIAYGVTMLADGVVLNTIEFWTDSNPVQAGLVREIQGENGKYFVETLENGYNVKDEQGNVVDFVFNAETKTWSIINQGVVTDLITFEDDNNAIVYYQGVGHKVEISETGVLAFQQEMNNTILYAVK